MYHCGCDPVCSDEGDCCSDYLDHCQAGDDRRRPLPHRPTPRPRRSPTPRPTRRPTPYPSKLPTRRPTPYSPTPKPKKSPTKAPNYGPDFCHPQTGPAALRKDVPFKFSADLTLKDAKVPRGSHPKPTYEDVHVCPAPENYPQVGPARAPKSGNKISWGDVPFRWNGKYYDTQSMLCTQSTLNNHKIDLPCNRRKQCESIVDVPLGLISATNAIVMPPYVTSVELHVDLDVTKGTFSENFNLKFMLDILETPNDPHDNPGGKCPGPADNKGRCYDRISVIGAYPTIYLPNGVKYAVVLEFYSPNQDDDTTGFWTKEMATYGADLELALKPLCP